MIFKIVTNPVTVNLSIERYYLKTIIAEIEIQMSYRPYVVYVTLLKQMSKGEIMKLLVDRGCVDGSLVNGEPKKKWLFCFIEIMNYNLINYDLSIVLLTHNDTVSQYAIIVFVHLHKTGTEYLIISE